MAYVTPNGCECGADQSNLVFIRQETIRYYSALDSSDEYRVEDGKYVATFSTEEREEDDVDDISVTCGRCEEDIEGFLESPDAEPIDFILEWEWARGGRTKFEFRNRMDSITDNWDLLLGMPSVDR